MQPQRVLSILLLLLLCYCVSVQSSSLRSFEQEDDYETSDHSEVFKTSDKPAKTSKAKSARWLVSSSEWVSLGLVLLYNYWLRYCFD